MLLIGVHLKCKTFEDSGAISMTQWEETDKQCSDYCVVSDKTGMLGSTVSPAVGA